MVSPQYRQESRDAALREDKRMRKDIMDREAFQKRLVELGYSLSDEDFECAFIAYLALENSN